MGKVEYILQEIYVHFIDIYVAKLSPFCISYSGSSVEHLSASVYVQELMASFISHTVGKKLNGLEKLTMYKQITLFQFSFRTISPQKSSRYRNNMK